MIWLCFAVLAALCDYRRFQAEERAKTLEMSVMFLSARVELLEEGK